MSRQGNRFGPCTHPTPRKSGRKIHGTNGKTKKGWQTVPRIRRMTPDSDGAGAKNPMVDKIRDSARLRFVRDAQSVVFFFFPFLITGRAMPVYPLLPQTNNLASPCDELFG